MGDVLGEGSYAKVKEAIDSETLVRTLHLCQLFYYFSQPILFLDSQSSKDNEEKET